MNIFEATKMTSKGQITIPNKIRKLLGLNKGATVAFGITKDGVVLLPCEVSVKSPYSEKEWKKIEAAVAEKGEIFSSDTAAKKYLASL